MKTFSKEKIKIHIKRREDCMDLPLPQYMSVHASGLDLMAAVDDDIVLKRFERKLILTGVSIALPDGYEAQIRPRSGLALKQGISIVNSPGTIDADYRGEIGVILINLGEEDFVVTRGMRIAQMIIQSVIHGEFEEVEHLPQSERSSGGFGHTGF